MPAYAQQHQQHHDLHAALTACPSCLGLSMQIKEVQPRWNLSRVDFVYECPACCTEVREIVARN